MCTDRDCKIFMGKLIACDDCERMSDKIAGFRTSASVAMGAPKAPRMP